MNFSRLIDVSALILVGCGTAHATSQPEQSATQAGPAIPSLAVGAPTGIDLLGDGKATVTVMAAEMGSPLVVTIKIRLDKAGKPVTGGPENFRFRDVKDAMHTARTDAAAFAPALPPVNLTTDGQEAFGKVVFDVAPEVAKGGHLQLMTGRLVHAVWKI